MEEGIQAMLPLKTTPVCHRYHPKLKWGSHAQLSEVGQQGLKMVLETYHWWHVDSALHVDFANQPGAPVQSSQL